LPTQNISQVVTHLTTGRFTASLEAQLQQTQIDASTLECTLRICVSPTICGAAKSIGTSWSTFLLTTQLRAHKARTISFVTSCSTPAYVAIRSIVFPGQGTGTAVQTVTSILPASTTTETVTETTTETSTKTTTEFSTTTEFAASTCAVGISTDISTTTSETCGSPSESTSVPAPDPTPDLPSSSPVRENWQVNIINGCPLQADWAVIATQPQVSVDTMIFTNWSSAKLTIVSDNANPTFFPISGGTLCATSQQTGQQWCGVETVTTHHASNFDTLSLNCSAPPQPPDMSNTIELGIHNNFVDRFDGFAPGSAVCNHFAYQIGCEPGNFCLGRGYENNQHENDYLGLRFPMLEPGARLRVRQTDVAVTTWRVSLLISTYSYTAQLRQTTYQGEWLVIHVPNTAARVSIDASCNKR
jgi:hypothetical protein